jgi:hypothetical protein
MTGRLMILSVIALAFLATQAQAEPCVITAEQATISGLRVQPAGEDGFGIDTLRVPVEVRPGEKGQGEILVRAPLRFTVEHALARLQGRLAKRVVLLDGRVVLARGLPLSFPGTSLGARDREDSIASTIPLQELRPKNKIAIPCEDLDLTGEPAENREWEQPQLELSGKAMTYVQSANKELPLYAEREAVDPFWFKFAGPLAVIREKDSWLRVRARWSDGSMLRGWIPKDRVTLLRNVPVHGSGGIGSLGFGHCGRSHRPALVKFRVHAHAPIHSGPRGAIWAHTAAAIQVEAFALRRSDGWVQIGKLEGLPSPPCGEHGKIWVHASHLLWSEKAP